MKKHTVRAFFSIVAISMGMHGQAPHPSIFETQWPTVKVAAPAFAAYTVAAPTALADPAVPVPMYTSVTISSATTGATFCYTTDGTTPTVNGAGACTNGSTGSSFLLVGSSSTEKVQAISLYPNSIPSDISTVTYTIDHTIPVFLGQAEIPETPYTPTYPVAVNVITTTSNLNVAAGQLLFGFCGASPNVSSTITSSPSNTFTLLAPITGPDNNAYQPWYTFATASGPAEFTCTTGTVAPLQQMVVLQYYPGSLTTLDTSTFSTMTTSPSNVWTSQAFTTTQKGLIIACGLMQSYGTFSAGQIGSQSATMRSVAGWTPDGASMCEEAVSTGAQAGITATVKNSATANWVGFVGAFK